MAETGFIYFVRPRRAKVVKIGFASDIQKRLATLQTGHHSKLEIMASIPGTMQDEHRWHKRFVGDRVRGEWFNLSDRLHATIDQLNDNGRNARARAMLAYARRQPEPTDDDIRAALEASESRPTPSIERVITHG